MMISNLEIMIFNLEIMISNLEIMISNLEISFLHSFYYCFFYCLRNKNETFLSALLYSVLFLPLLIIIS